MGRRLFQAFEIYRFYLSSSLLTLHSGIAFDFYPKCMSSHILTLHHSFSLFSPVRRLYSNHLKSIQFDECKAGDVVMIEIDIRSSTPSERTMHLFINGTQQKPYAINLYPSICFMTEMCCQKDYMTFTEYQRVSNPTHTHIAGESSFACQ